MSGQLQILLPIYLMKEQPQSKKWVDYSDSDSPDEESTEVVQNVKSDVKAKHQQKPSEKRKVAYIPSKQQTNKQLDKLDDLDYLRVDEVWLDMFSENVDYLADEMNYLKGKVKKGGNVVAVFPTNQPERFQIKVYIKIAYDYIRKGYDAHDYIRVTVAAKNFEKKSTGERTQNRDKERGKGDYKDKGATQKQGDKKKYVDKQTGKAPEIISKPEQKSSLDERKYTKEEAEKKGQMLGQFRNKPIRAEQPETKQEVSKPNAEQKPQVKKQQIKVNEKFQNTKNGQSKVTEPKKQKVKKQKKAQGSKLQFKNHFEGMLDL